MLYGGAGIGIYLVIFCGWMLSGPLRKHADDYQQLVAEAQSLQEQLKPYGDRIVVTKKMMETYQLDPAKLDRATVVGEASAKIQRTAASSGMQVGSVRESAARSSAKELATLQFQGSGPIPAVLGLLKRMETLGYPLVIDSVEVTPDPNRPDQLKLNLTVVILDFDQWKGEAKSHA